MNHTTAALPRVAPVAGWTTHLGTLAHPVTVRGRGLHTGRRVVVTVHPAPPGHGVVFQRRRKNRDLGSLPAAIDHHYAQIMCTALRGPDGLTVRTTEHFLAALFACGLDDVLVVMDGEELPIFDGSARPWIERLADGGRIDQPIPRRFIQILEEIRWEEHPRHHILRPAVTHGYEITARLTLRGLGDWSWAGTLTPDLFAADIAPARSFGRLKMAVPAILYGYARGIPILRGAHPWSAAAIVGTRVIGGKRMDDEFMRHKLVDLVGDLALLGAPILGHLDALRPSHEANYALLCAMRAAPAAWRVVEIDPTLSVSTSTAHPAAPAAQGDP